MTDEVEKLTGQDEIDEALANLNRAVTRLVNAYRAKNGDEEVYVSAWVAHAEFLTMEGVKANNTSSMSLNPDGQLVSTSLGLHILGENSYNIRRRAGND